MSKTIREIVYIDDSVHGDLNPMEKHCYPKVTLATTFRAFPSDSEDNSEEEVEDDEDTTFDPFVDQQNHIRFDSAARNPNAPTGTACEEDYLRTTNTPRKRKLSLYHPDRMAAPRKKKRKLRIVCDGEDYAANVRGESARYQLDMRALKEDNRPCAWQRHEMEEDLWVTHLRQIRILKRMHGIVDEDAVRQHAARKKAEADVAAIDWAEEHEYTLRSFDYDESDNWSLTKFWEYRCINASANSARPREKIPRILCTSTEDEVELDRSQQETLFYEDLKGEPEAIEQQEEVQRYEAELEAFHCTSLLPLRRRSDAEKDMWETHIQTLVDIKTRRETRMETEDEEKKLAQLNDGVTREDGSDSFVADAGQARSELPEAGASQPDPAPKLMHTTTASVAKQDTDKSSVVVMEPTPPMSEDEVDPSNGKFTPSIDHAQPSSNHSTRAELHDVVKKMQAMLDTIRFARDEIRATRRVQSTAIAQHESQHETDQQTIKKLQDQAERYRQERNDAWETAESYLVQRDKALDDRNAAYETGEIWVRERDEAWRREEDLSM